MFRSIQLENFKAFGERTVVELAPITLIFGQNSAGKSSILQALTLLKQTRESRESGAPLLPRAEEGITDLGSFQEMLFDHELSRTLSIGLQVEMRENRFYRSMSRRLFGDLNPDSIGISLRFQRPAPEDEVQVSGFDIELPELGESLASFSPRTLEKEERSFVGSYFWHPSRSRQRSRQRKLLAADCTHLSDRRHIWKGIHSKWFEHATAVGEALERLRKDSPASGLPLLPETDPDESTVSQADRADWLNSVDNAMQFYSSEFALDQFVSRMTSQARTAVVALDGFIPVPLHRGIFGAPELFAVHSRRSKLSDAIPLLDVTRLAPFVGYMLDQTLESLFPMGPFRRPPERWYIFTGTSPEDVGYRGDLLPDLLFRRADLIEEANTWLERLDIGYVLRVRAIGGASDLFEVRLVDRRREGEVNVALSDVGFGISQILPFIVQTLASSGQVISIEQPEVHLHPKLQADLGDLLTTAIEKPYRHQFLVETHSEHLILRLQKLVRERKLRPEDISVIFVSRGGAGSSARRLRLDDDGRFMDEWPGGFFAERLRELV